MKFGVVSQWFDPEPGPASLPGVLARGLAARGHEVQVVTGFPNYPTGKIYPGYTNRRRTDSVDRGVRIRRVAIYPSHDRSVPKRIANYASFGASAAVSGLSALANCDAVWVSNSPITVAPTLALLRRRYRVPTLLHVLDLWPDTMTASGMVGPSVGGRLAVSGADRVANAMYRSASHVATISPGVTKLLASRGVPAEKLSYVPMWADESVYKPSDGSAKRSELGVGPETIVVLYAGTMGGAQGIETLIEACARNPTRQEVECWLVGSGTHEDELRLLAKQKGSGGVRTRFFGRMPPQDMPPVMAAADVHYVGLRPDPLSAITMPSKIQATLASGKPMIVAAEGDARNVVVDRGVGFAATPGDADSVSAVLAAAAGLGRAGLAELGTKARSVYQAEYSEDRGIGAVESLLTRMGR